jgi:hypothetical protein
MSLLPRETLALLRRRWSRTRDYREVFGGEAGERVLRDLLRNCGVLETSMEAGDPHMTAWRDGRRSVALEIMEVLRYEETQLVQLARERGVSTEQENAA